jgi:hypothetical protein
MRALKDIIEFTDRMMQALRAKEPGASLTSSIRTWRMPWEPRNVHLGRLPSTRKSTAANPLADTNLKIHRLIER